MATLTPTDTRHRDRASERLPPGPAGLPRGQVTEIQRARMIAAAVDAVAELGYGRMTVAEVIGRAKVSRKTFYDLFDDREDCFLAAFEHGVKLARSALAKAQPPEREWRTAMRAAVACLLSLIEDEPRVARLCVVEALAAGERVLERRAQVMAEIAAAISRGRDEPGSVGPADEMAADGVAGGLAQILHERLRADTPHPFGDLFGPLMSIVVTPYLGVDAAREELAREPPRLRSRDRPTNASTPSADPLRGLNMRLTYRTVRVLSVIGQLPGASNREVGESAGIADQGQISKLLSRLARLGLIENHGEGQEHGAANAWRLTDRGARVESATRPLSA